MRKLVSAVLAAACGALLCVSLPSSGLLAPRGGAAAAPNPGHGQASLGAAVAAVGRAGGARSLRMPGRVALDEARVYRVNAGVSGSIRDVSPVVTGSRVRKDQLLGSFYAPETSMAVSLFLVHTLGYDPAATPRSTPPEANASRASSSLYEANLQRRTAELENMGVSAAQRADIARTGRIPDTIEIRAPGSGVVMERSVSPGMKFDRGAELFRIADLRKVWVVADVFPQDARYVRPGLLARVSVPEQGIEAFATIDRILPEVDPATRTPRVRLEVDNAGEALLPGMLVDVRVDVELPPAAVVPAEAVVDAGTSQVVYVRSPAGALAARAVTTGWRAGDRVEVVRGLAPGERVVAAAAFVLDSETRLRAPGAGADAMAVALDAL
jgi:Cu(I)/Ag(I) efflux system membrane fusion protein